MSGCIAGAWALPGLLFCGFVSGGGGQDDLEGAGEGGEGIGEETESASDLGAWRTAMSEWISVKDRLPKDGDKVLVSLKSGDACCGEYCAAHGFTCSVTHWMPLPEPPPKPDAFEEWWETQRVMRLAKEVGVTYLIAKHEARSVWDAAVAATKKEG